MNIYILTILKQADDSYYPDYEYIYGAYSTREKAEEAAINLRHKHKTLQSDSYDFNGCEITKCTIDADDGNVEDIIHYCK